MTSKAQISGMRGVYLVASELARRGLITSPTSRSARGADILATTSDCTRAFSVEVKTTTNQKFWLLAEHAKSITAKSHIYVLVHIRQAKNGDWSAP
jgi:Holliday junction resolvase